MAHACCGLGHGRRATGPGAEDGGDRTCLHDLQQVWVSALPSEPYQSLETKCKSGQSIKSNDYSRWKDHVPAHQNITSDSTSWPSGIRGQRRDRHFSAGASLSKALMALEDELKSIYAKSLEMSSPQSTVLLGLSQTGHKETNTDATDIQPKEPTGKRGRKRTPILAASVVHSSKFKRPSVKFRGPNGETWTGQGRTPRWLSALEANGALRSEFFVKS